MYIKQYQRTDTPNKSKNILFSLIHIFLPFSLTLIFFLYRSSLYSIFDRYNRACARALCYSFLLMSLLFSHVTTFSVYSYWCQKEELYTNRKYNQIKNAECSYHCCSSSVLYMNIGLFLFPLPSLSLTCNDSFNFCVQNQYIGICFMFFLPTHQYHCKETKNKKYRIFLCTRPRNACSSKANMADIY